MTTQTNGDELERKKFEKWLDENSYNKQRDQVGLYQCGFTQIAWMGWLARSKQGEA
ncbi:hypothetical protein ABNP39_08110 [Pantoea dispersa]|uniref:hypothetical protein n=1 Tax=Pantoea dispersa TaxID=59814 RepID=UPI0032F088E9